MIQANFNSIRSMGSAFSGFDIFVVPDDNDEAAKQFETEILEAATQTSVAFKDNRMYVRASLWGKMKPELERIESGGIGSMTDRHGDDGKSDLVAKVNSAAP